MGDFQAGHWIIFLLLYFFFFFLGVFSFLNAANSIGTDTSGIRLDDPGFVNASGQFGTPTNTTTTNLLDDFSWGNVKATFNFMIGFGQGATLGIPAVANWIFSFIFFYIPFMMLVWAIYMGLPFLH